MSAQEKRLITSHTSKLGKLNLVDILRGDVAWEDVPVADRERLYGLLPKVHEMQPDTAWDVHPLKTVWGSHIERAVREWQRDLANGCEEKKWRHGALQTSRERREGKWEEWEGRVKKEAWGKEGVEEDEQVLEGENGDAEHEEKPEESSVVEMEVRTRGGLVLDS